MTEIANNNFLSQDFAERGDEYSLIIERILILIRNVLYVPANPNEFRPDNDASVHDQVSCAVLNNAFGNKELYCRIMFVIGFMGTASVGNA